MNTSECAHRWANRQLNKNGIVRSSHTHGDAKDYYSYSTVIARRVTDDIVLICDDYFSVTTSKHCSELRSACSHLKQIKCHRYRGYGVDIVNPWTKTKWCYAVLDVLFSNIKDTCNGIIESCNSHSLLGYVSDVRYLYANKHFTKAGCKEYCSRLVQQKIDTILKCDLEIGQILKHFVTKKQYEYWLRRSEITEKANKTRRLMNWVNAHNMSIKNAAELRKILSGKQELGIERVHACINSNYKRKSHTEHGAGLYYYITGINSDWHDTLPTKVRNVFTGEIYTMKSYGTLGFFDKIFEAECALSPFISLHINEYLEANDHVAWLKHFYKKCKISAQKFSAINSYRKMLENEPLTDVQKRDAQWVVSKIKAYREDKRKQQIAAEAEKKRIEEEKKRCYDALWAQGIDGRREIWRKKLDSISKCSCDFNDANFYYGGNVLFRWKNEDTVETSKFISISITQAKAAWKMIQKWHNNPKSFKKCDIATKSGVYTVVAYKNDILTAGCHDIAYCEMERMYKEIELKIAQNG